MSIVEVPYFLPLLQMVPIGGNSDSQQYKTKNQEQENGVSFLNVQLASLLALIRAGSVISFL